MIKCCIIDDEPLAIKLIAEYIAKVEDLELINTYSNPIKAIQDLIAQPVDLLFLDVQMPELNGLQFMKILDGKSSVILTTAYSEYALKGYDFDIVDYLMKPIAFDRFMIAVNKAKQRIDAPQPTQVSVASSDPTFIWVKSEYKHQKIDLADIYYLESLGDYVAIHLKEKKILTLQKMKQFEESLPHPSFVRIHKSYIVSIDKINYIERNRVVIKEEYLPIGGTYQKAFWDVIK